MLPHKHLMVNAETGNIRDVLQPEEIKQHVLKLAHLISAKIIIEPQVRYCDSVENTGYIAIAGIGTSHITCHHWDNTQPQRLQLDIYSCTEYDEKIALKEIWHFWQVVRCNFWLVRRSELFNFTIESQGVLDHINQL